MCRKPLRHSVFIDRRQGKLRHSDESLGPHRGWAQTGTSYFADLPSTTSASAIPHLRAFRPSSTNRWLKTVVVSDVEKAHVMRQVGIGKTVRSPGGLGAAVEVS